MASNVKYEVVSIADLDIRENNPNEMSQEQLESLQYSIKKNGYVQPIIINQDNIIVDGTHRYRALKRLGVEAIDIVRVFTKNQEELKLLSQTMNKLRGSHDLKKDITEMEILMGYDPDELKSLLGFDETGLDLMRQRAAEEEQQISNLNTADVQPVEKRDVEFKANLKHQCPSCGYIFK